MPAFRFFFKSPTNLVGSLVGLVVYIRSPGFTFGKCCLTVFRTWRMIMVFYS